ncbi:Na+/H+ antiporter subunit A [Siminovitchia acidinfaciens]|uniref:Na+/H+ antiporter subunit A n=1 Tax=Siminovitchia acidinfaciens TaxID=2321395 RepID=A0A429XWJ2_9BACI|nr:Na+/H+ antiporter subunit A [Siminovitchia acidinfaciens]RST72763.1 Na+/H+ antiporter subunit A [Siminovitchia acidinfaciens]
MLTVNLIIMIPFLAAIFLPILFKRNAPNYIGWLVFLVPAALFIAIARYIPSVANGNIYLNKMMWIPSYSIDFTTYLDGLSLIFGLLITGIGSLVILYSIYYLSSEESLKHFYIYLLLFMGSMLGVVFSDNLMVLYVFWELTSISSFLLIAFWFHRKGSRYGAQKAMLITVSGGLAMLTSFIMIYLMTGTMNIREIIAAVDINHPLFTPALVLLLIGAFTKSAQFPFHIWLPDAMEAPTPVSAYLHSATMVKAGIYLVARFTPVFGEGELWFWLVTGIGLVTLSWGSFTAVRQTDLKALLAYSTISQLGLIMSLLGIGSMSLDMGASMEAVLFTQATFAGLFHLINHSTFKGALFMVVGIVDHEVGTRDIRRLGGLMSFMPVSFTIAMIGSFSMAGLPPFNGFLSKEMFFAAVLNITQVGIFSLDTWGILIPVIAWTASVFTFVYSMIIVFKTFLGTSRLEVGDREVHEAPVGMLIPPSILAALVLAIFFFPNIVGDYLLRPAMVSIFPSLAEKVELGQHISVWHGFNMEVFMTIGVVAFGSLLYVYMRKWKGVFSLFPTTWSFDILYNNTLLRLESSSSAFTRFYMTGILRDYLLYIYLFFILVIGGALFMTGAFSISQFNQAPIRLFEWILVLVMMAAGISIPFAATRVTAILLNGVLGYGIAALFVVLRAPDLALTQIVVETVTTALFLVCFYFLPQWERGEGQTAPKVKLLNLFISISVGVIFVLGALSVQSGKLFTTISGFFEKADELTGGKNIVNAILGDFRAFDTMLEVVVLFIAGIGVYTLTKLKLGKGGDKVEDQ